MNLTLFQDFIFTFYIFWIFIDTIFWGSLWQEKEYRWDRFSVFFKENLKAKEILFSPLSLLKIFAIIFYIFSVFTSSYSLQALDLIYLIYTLQFLLIVKNIFLRKIKRPVITLKSLVIVGLSFITLLVIIFNPLTGLWFWLLIVDKLLLLIISFYVFLFFFPTEIIEGIIIYKASKKIKKRSDILVIAVSGSYGKTSTKEYVAQILSAKFNVVKTLGSNNTPMGIARTILNNIKNDTHIFVVEMGAYKIGEIAQLCSIVKPQISITTGISDQHLSLYGNMENVIKSETELLENLPKNSLSIFNGNSLFMERLIKKCKGKKIIYYSNNNLNSEFENIYADNIKVSQNKTTFDFFMNNNKYSFETEILGKHVIENLLPALYLGFIKGLSYKEISAAVKLLKSPNHTLNRIIINKNIIGIDDTFNTSPQSVMSASEYISIYKTKKIIILSPLVELGKNAKLRHIEIGEILGKNFNEIILTNKNYFKEIVLGIKKSNKKPDIQVLDYNKIYEKIKDNKGKVVVLFEGKEAGIVLKKFL